MIVTASASRSCAATSDGFPFVVEPTSGHVDLASWVDANRSAIEGNLARHGALLFRDFAVKTAADFEAASRALTGRLLEYRERSSPRTQIAGNVYTSTEYPPEQRIFLHNEQSYNLVFPRRILFFCAVAATAGGETPIADVRKVFRRIDRTIRNRFLQSGYSYVRNFMRGFGLSWQTAFQTDDRQAVESYCQERAITCEWLPGNRLRTRQVRRVAANHPVTGEAVWFNHATFFHISTLEPSMRRALLSAFPADELPNNTYHGDGSPIEPEVMEHLRTAYEAETVTFQWQQGDLLLLDNMLAAHGRASFQGPRSVMVGMAQPHDWHDVSAPEQEL